MKYDVAIVGAGPAGSTTAKFLSENGFNVLLTDKSKFPRDKACGGGLPTKIFEKYGYLTDDDLIESYTNGGIIYSPSQKYKIEVKKGKPILGMVIRKKFDHELVKLAINEGTTFIEGKKTTDVKISDKKTEITLEGGEKIESDIIIGADGVWSIIAKKTGLIKDKRNVSISLCSELTLTNKKMDEYFGKDRYGLLHLKVLGISGYGWVFPKKKHVNIGIGEINLETNKTINKKNLKKILEQYIKLLKDTSIIPKDLVIKKINGAAIPNYPLKKTYSDRLIMVGDAAGFANPFTGEGIFNAMISGEIAANTIKKSLENNDTSSNSLYEYEMNWKKEFGKDLDLFIKSARLWNRENENFIKHVSRDEILSEYLLDVASGNIGIHKIRRKLIRRYLYCVIKDKIKYKN
jgi:geranylgeranyl reductase family protein